jgi:hypothetical protein
METKIGKPKRYHSAIQEITVVPSKGVRALFDEMG